MRIRIRLRNRARRNDGGALERLGSLRKEMERVRRLADAVARREKLKAHLLAVEVDRFEQVCACAWRLAFPV